MRRSTAGQRGFTLLELIISLAVFSIMSVMAYSGLKIVLDSKGGTEERAKRLSSVQTAMMFMERDIEQIIDRSIRDGFGMPQEALVGVPYGQRRMEFTRAGWRNPLGGPRSQMQRVGYQFDEGVLSRVSWVTLDRANETDPIARPLVDNVENVNIRYLSGVGSWTDSWPVSSAGTLQPAPRLPLAVEVELEFKDLGKIRRLFRVPASKP
ncbi:MAG: type II secretion system minor pseudopilin GspJ [Gammaproteobacteria bacterium]|nr:type II secretion system minor pseudopilin GspJ [Gammaproteobacteria bacterium]